MSSNYKVIDNFLSKGDFKVIQDAMFSAEFFWYYNYTLDGIAHEHPTKDYYFTHAFFDVHKSSKSKAYTLILPLLSNLNIFDLIRVKGNLYPGTDIIVEDPMHVDYEIPHTGAVFSINTNNGYTKLEDGTKIQSIENRILIFDSSKPHCSGRCTDEKVRININLNYFERNIK